MVTTFFSSLPQLSHYFVIVLAGFGAGALNAVAGGGTFLSFPALLATGMPPIMANASNSVALWPGSLAAAWAFRVELWRFRRILPGLSVLALAGGVGGGLLLLSISNALFTHLIPWLLLLATLVFAYSQQISLWVHKRSPTSSTEPGAQGAKKIGIGGYCFQLLVSIYGGFFGAGMGILMLAALAIQGFADLHEVNALKNWLSALIYSVTVLTFILAGAISWPHTLVMLVAATIGGYGGARLARRIPAIWLKRFIVSVGGLLAIYYFYKI